MPGDATILDLAVIGSRIRGFNHDAASKLQRLMMATSEVDELAGPGASPDHRAAIEALYSALGELEALFVEHRLLAKGSEPAAVNLAGALARAGRRANIELALDLDPAVVRPVRELELVQALAQLLDAVAGAKVTRTIAVVGRAAGDRIELAIPVDPGADAELAAPLALLAHVLARTGGSIAREATTIRVVI